jgi:alkanesulfonate monooxygenase SsuD/methylene tetrahydromethanopterin reductase-like flavin-dependent oxidoreductase (luciferase family)
VCIIRDLLDGGYVNFKGTHFRVDAARIWDLPDRSVPLGIAVSGQQRPNVHREDGAWRTLDIRSAG